MRTAPTSSLQCRFCRLFLILALVLYAAPALADVPSPGRDRARAASQSWKQRFPNQSPPDLKVTPGPDGQSLILDIACKGPCMYSYTLQTARGEDERQGEGEIDELGGAKRSERLTLPALSAGKETSLRLKLYYTLYGVESTLFGPKRTDKTLSGCAIWGFYAAPGDKGTTELREGGLDGSDYFELRNCNP